MEQQMSPMGRLARFVIATDGSEFTVGARKVGVDLAKKAVAKIFPVMMVYVNPEYAALAPQLVEKAENDAMAHLKTIVEAAQAAGVEAEPLIRHGDLPHEVIVGAAGSVNADVIVVGRRGRRGLARIMVGDATVKVIGAARCSVLVVPKAAAMWQKRILLATDGSRFGDAAAVAAANVARCCKLPVTVVGALVPSHSAQRQQEGRDAVARTVDYLKKEGFDAEGVVEPGEAADVIAAAADTAGADLIVMGTHGRTGFERVLVGSVAERVIGLAKCPILVVK
ncbi:MAG: universal stress protein [Magnetospirillum sp. WYHS-4]